MIYHVYDNHVKSREKCSDLAHFPNLSGKLKNDTLKKFLRFFEKIIFYIIYKLWLYFTYKLVYSLNPPKIKEPVHA